MNEAARLTEAAKARLGRVLASEETIARSAGEGRGWDVVGELDLRGRSSSTLAFEPAPSGRGDAALRELVSRDPAEGVRPS